MIGDDILVTDAARVRRAAEAGACNAVLIKVNQRERSVAPSQPSTRRAIWVGAPSYRPGSGETEDVSIVHLAVGWDAGQLKVGSFARSERMAKWNELLRIEDDLGEDAEFAGWGAFAATIGANRGKRVE